MDTLNRALLTTDVIIDAGRLLDSSTIGPGEFHALNSLIEAIVLHEKAYVYELPDSPPSKLYEDLVRYEVLEPSQTADIFEDELTTRGLEELAGEVLLDRAYGRNIVAYSPEGAIETLRCLIEYEKHLGFSRMSQLQQDNEEIALHFARLLSFSTDDVILLDDTFRKMRAVGTCAVELNLEIYTGLVSRPFLLDYLNSRRRGALQLFERMKVELDDVDDSDLPQWRRFEIPALTQVVLQNCRDSSAALVVELLALREQLASFRETLTAQALDLKTAKTRGEKRRVRKEAEKAWNALLTKQDTTSRLTHQLWDIAKNPLKIHEKVGDKLVEKDKLDQAVQKVQGLTDLWSVLSDAPTIEANATLLRRVFRADCEASEWQKVQALAAELEVLMRRDEDPKLGANP